MNVFMFSQGLRLGGKAFAKCDVCAIDDVTRAERKETRRKATS